jgi:single-stranded-DNA-specific exonuclease
MLRKRWIGPSEIPAEQVRHLVDELQVSPAVARVLASRGKNDVEEARRFLHPSLDQLSPPEALLGATVAIERILRALRNNERILVFGDFDVDGVTGTSLALRTLRTLGARVDSLLPRRLVHGYGLSLKVLPDVLERRPALVITVDCGIRSVEEVAALNRAGVDTIITDHHEPGPQLPPAVAVVDPKQPGCTYPDKRLAGVGVMYQLLRGVVSRLEHELDLRRQLDLVAMGTVADVVPLDGENRVLVSEGLRVLSRREKVGVMELAMACGIEGPIETWHLAYLVGPRINAAGRLGDAGEAVTLLTTNDTALANRLAKRLDAENLKRQEISGETLQQALDAIAQGVIGEHPDAVVLACNTWHPGVIGIASAKIVERFHRPSALIAMDGGVGRGSIRSIRGIDACEVLDECRDLLVQYGGHAMAAGFTIERDNVAGFRTRFTSAVSSRLTEDNASPRLRIDSELTPDEVDLPLAEDLERLGPFGFGNSRPVLLLSGVSVAGRKIVGRGHLKMGIRRPSRPTLDVIGFDFGDRAERDFPDGAVDIVGHLAINEWNGRRTAQLQLADYREAIR